jgi:holo-[acyl-carrier protein] synthase
MASLIGIGLDLVDIPRFEQAMARHGQPFLDRLFTAEEQLACEGQPTRLAARFAAKEAVAKAYGTGIGEAMAFREIEVINLPSGAPQIVLHGAARSTAMARHTGHIFVSLTHTATTAAAQIVIMSQD